MSMREETMGKHPGADHLERGILKVCDSVGDFIEYWGFKANYGRVWTLMALRNAPMSQSEIARRLGVSRSLISGVMTDLEEWGLAKTTSTARNARWVAVIDVWPTITDVLRGREWSILEGARHSLESAIEEAELAQARGERVEYDVGRMKWLLAMTQTAQRLLRLLISLRSAPPTEHLGGWISRASSLIRGVAHRLSDS